ncbi:MAG: hypothetical protein R3236_05045, partial [Phycisphaeraceae bacterium]|nr:hypothetical protein [Phycisphaeraceae bacterium]
MIERLVAPGCLLVALAASTASGQSLTKKHDLPGQDLPVQSVAFSSDGKLIAAGDGVVGGNKEYGPGQVGFVRVYETESKREVIRRKMGGPVAGVVLTEKPKYVVASSFKDLKAYRLLHHDQHRDYEDHPKGYGAVALAAEGSRIVAVTRGETGAGPIAVWDFNSRRIVHRISGSYTTLKISADGKTLVAGTDDNRVAVFNTADWKQKAVMGKSRAHRPITTVAVSRDGQKVFGWANGEGGHIWGATGGEPTASLKITDKILPTMGPVHDAVFTPD